MFVVEFEIGRIAARSRNQVDDANVVGVEGGKGELKIGDAGPDGFPGNLAPRDFGRGEFIGRTEIVVAGPRGVVVACGADGAQAVVSNNGRHVDDAQDGVGRDDGGAADENGIGEADVVAFFDKGKGGAQGRFGVDGAGLGADAESRGDEKAESGEQSHGKKACSVTLSHVAFEGNVR